MVTYQYKAAALTAAALILATSLSGCTSNGQDKPVTPVYHISSSRVHEYTSIAELRDDSALVLEGTVARQDFHDPDAKATDPDPRTQNTIAVSKVLQGTYSQPTIVVVQNQTPTWVDDEAPPVFAANATYLLFLVRTELPKEDPDAANYYVTGSAGVYKIDGDGFTRQDRSH